MNLLLILQSMSYYGFISLFNGLVALTIGVYVYNRNSKNPLYVSFALLAASIACWSITYAIWQSQETKAQALLFIRLTMAFCNFIPFTFLWFVQTVIDDKPKNEIPFYFGIPIFFSIAYISPLMIQDVVPQLFFRYWPKPGQLMHFWILLFNSVVGFSFYLLFKEWNKSVGPRRWQLRWITISTLIMWLGGLTNWFLWYGIPIPPLPNFCVAITLLILAHAILRRGLFDIDTLANLIREAKLSAIGMMAASMNHELRNPLFIAKGKIESQLDAIERGIHSSLEDEAHRSRVVLKTALDQLTRAMDIMQRFSDFARPQIKEEKKSKIVVREVVQDVLSLVSNEFKMRKINFTSSLNGEMVLANRRQLEEVFFNLIMNACQALRTGTSPCITISAAQRNGHVNIFVKDNGPGITTQQLSRIFEPFYTTKKEGTGLGLYITKQLVERNNGRISVKSEPGTGAEFNLEFKR